AASSCWSFPRTMRGSIPMAAPLPWDIRSAPPARASRSRRSASCIGARAAMPWSACALASARASPPSSSVSEPAIHPVPQPLSRHDGGNPALSFPHGAPPAPGGTIEVAPGVRWLRMPLPFALDHINLWLVADGAGWTIVDSGLDTEETKALWLRIFE